MACKFSGKFKKSDVNTDFFNSNFTTSNPMFEHKNQKVISRPRFKRRVAKYAAVASGMIGVSWIIGAVGYRYLTNPPPELGRFFLQCCHDFGGNGSR